MGNVLLFDNKRLHQIGAMRYLNEGAAPYCFSIDVNLGSHPADEAIEQVPLCQLGVKSGSA
jgi:hypothetical protein